MEPRRTIGRTTILRATVKSTVHGRHHGGRIEYHESLAFARERP